MGRDANTLKSWKLGHGFEKVENPWFNQTNLDFNSIRADLLYPLEMAAQIGPLKLPDDPSS